MKMYLKTDFKTNPPKLFKRNGWYCYRQRIAGNDVWRSLRTKNKVIAEMLVYKVWFYQQGKDLQDILDFPPVQLSELWDDYADSEKYKLLEPSTQKTKLKRWNCFLKFCSNKKVEFSDKITRNLALEFLEEHGVASNKTFNNYKNDMFQIFKAFYDKRNQENVFAKIEQRSVTRGAKASKDYRIFSDDEITTILSKIKISKMDNRTEWYYACLIALYTGLRFKDVALLQWPEVKDDFRYIEHAPFKTANVTDNKAVIININNDFRNVLKEMPKTSFYLLPNLAKNYNEEDSTKYFARFLKGIKITAGSSSCKVGFHSFRSTVVTKAERAGVDMKSFGGVVGHTTEKQTKHYNKDAEKIDLSFLHYKIM